MQRCSGPGLSIASPRGSNAGWRRRAGCWRRRRRMMRAVALTAYGVVCYTASMLSLIMLFAWLGGFGFFPIRLDDGIGSWTPGAVAWNTAIMLAFALYHSVFARTVVKKRMRLLVGRNLERATYNLISAVLAVRLCLAWQPIPLR